MQLQNVVIPAPDFESTVAFYRDVLSLPVLQASDAFCFLRAGRVNIAIHPFPTDSPFAPTGHGLYLDFAVPDLTEIRQRLVDASIPLLREWIDEGTPFLLIADPCGNRMEIYAPVPDASA